MAISGLVITLTRDSDQQRAVLAALARHVAIDVGEVSGHRLPIVVESADSDEDRAIWDWLHALEGVQFVELAYLHLEDDHTKDREDAVASRTAGQPHASGPPSEKDFRS